MILNSIINHCPKIGVSVTKPKIYGIKIRIPLKPSKCFQFMLVPVRRLLFQRQGLNAASFYLNIGFIGRPIHT